MLTRIVHTQSITACGKLIITALVSNCDWGGRDSYSRRRNPSPSLSPSGFAAPRDKPV